MKSIADIKAIKEKMQSEIITREQGSNLDTRIIIGMATCGIAAGARNVFNAIIDEVATRKLKNIKVSRTGCLGMCRLEPIVEVFVPGQEKITYIKVDAEKAKNIIAKHIVNGNICTEYLAEKE